MIAQQCPEEGDDTVNRIVHTGRSLSTIKPVSMSATGSAKAVRAHDAFTHRLSLIDGELFVGKAVGDPLIVFVAMSARQALLAPPKREGELMDLFNALKELLHGEQVG